MSYLLRIDLEPHSKGRPRARVINGHASVYTPPETEQWEKTAAEALRVQWGTRQPIDREIAVVIRCVKAPLKSGKASSRRLRQWRTGSNDVDNEAKAVLDALVKAGVLKDDRCVVQLVVSKVRHGAGGHPCVEVIISEPLTPPKPLPGAELQALAGDGSKPLADPETVAKTAPKLTTNPIYGGEYTAPQGPDIRPRPYVKPE